MKITKMGVKHLRNDEYFQFHTEFKDLVVKHGAEALKIQPQFTEYILLYEKVDEGIKKIVKSIFTAEIQKADKARDDIWFGMTKMNAAALRHFDPDVREAAKRLKIVFDAYGNIARKPRNEQTSAVHNILQELEGTYAADAAYVGIVLWAEELKAKNIAFSDLMRERFDETAMKSDVVLRKARTALDEAYQNITERVNALALVEGPEAYELFIRSVNVVVDKYTIALAQRYGRRKSGVKAAG